MSYRPITDSWILCRPKVKYYGAYPNGFLGRARALLGVGINDPVLHVCGGMIRKYPCSGLGPNDKTLDLNPKTNPDYLEDAKEPFPLRPTKSRLAGARDLPWDAVLIDRPYTDEDFQKYLGEGLALEHYQEGLVPANLLIKNAIGVLPVGGKVGMLDYVWPQPPKNAKEVAVVAVYCGRNGRARVFTVFERLS